MWKEVLANIYESVLFTVFLLFFLGFRKNSWKNIAAAVVCSVLLAVNICISDAISIFHWYPFILDFIITFVFYKCVLKGRLREFIVAYLVYQFGLYLCSNLIIWSFYAFKLDAVSSWMETAGRYRLLMLVLNKILITIYVWGILRYRSGFSFYHRSYYIYFTGIGLIGMFLVSALTQAVMQLYKTVPEIGNHILMVLMCLMVLLILLFVLVIQVSKSVRYKTENDAMHSVIDSQKHAVEQLIQREREFYKWEHDLRNRIRSVCYVNQKDAQEGNKALKKLYEEISGGVEQPVCETNIWDYIMQNKCLEKKKIVFYKKIDIESDKIEIDIVELGILLGNLFDNAIEALERSTISEKYISLEIHLKLGILGITVKNPIQQGSLTEGEWKTTKEESRRHGFGIPSVKKIAEKYDGSGQFYIENGEFVADIQMDNRSQ